MSTHVDPRNQYIRLGRGLRTVSSVTLYSKLKHASEDESAVSQLLDAVVACNGLTKLKGQLYGILLDIPSRKLDSWKNRYIRRHLEALSLTSALSDTPIEVFANLEVGYHTDAFQGEGIFCAAVVAGPPRDIVFPQTGVRHTLQPGSMAVFDPAIVHGLLPAGASIFSDQKPEKVRLEEVSVFLSAELRLAPEVVNQFDIRTIEGGRMPSPVHRPDLENCCWREGTFRSQQTALVPV